MIFKNRRLANPQDYEMFQNKIESQNRNVVTHTYTVDEGLGIDRSDQPLVWDPTIASMTYITDNSVVLCKIIADDDNSLLNKAYPKAPVVDAKDLLGE